MEEKAEKVHAALQAGELKEVSDNTSSPAFRRLQKTSRSGDWRC
jgi:hypothetical protein